MKKHFLAILLSLATFAVQSQTTISYPKPLPKINAQGVIKMPDGQTQTIENYSDTEGSVFFIIRHSEKDTTGGSNADLNPVGRGRAKALRQMLKKVKINGIYSTNTPRTKNTAAPTAKHKHLPVEIYDPKKQKELLSSLVDKKGKFLIVGHSNTVHKLVNVLTNTEQEKEFSESDYTRLYIVSVKKIGTAKVLMIHF
jgi:phosphohistidine phosphatase SixA